jgi:hypothetical protein
MSDEVDAFLAHHGIKGMHWGVRKERVDVYRQKLAEVQVDPDIHKSTKDAAEEVSGFMRDRYGLDIKSVKAIRPGNPEWPTTAAYVENNSVYGGRSEGTIFVQARDMSKILKAGEETGWVAPGTGNIKGMMTHESFHAAFHSDESIKPGFLGPKVVGGHIKERNEALKAAIKEANKSGMSIWSTSGYAQASGLRQELEAELFTQYNWADNPAPFVVAYGKSLNNELGVDPTPFKDVKLDEQNAGLPSRVGIP